VSAGGDISSETAETIAPDGSVTYNFNGHIAATGVDIVADTADLTTPQFTKPSEAQGANSVRWLRASDGAMVAQVAGSRATRLYHGANVQLSEAALAAIDPAAVGGYAEAMLLAARNPDLQNRLQEWAALLARAHDDPGTGSVDAGYPGLFVEAGQLVGGALNESSTLLWDYLGHSDFAMRAPLLEASVGTVAVAAGAIDPPSATVIVQLPAATTTARSSKPSTTASSRTRDQQTTLCKLVSSSTVRSSRKSCRPSAPPPQYRCRSMSTPTSRRSRASTPSTFAHGNRATAAARSAPPSTGSESDEPKRERSERCVRRATRRPAAAPSARTSASAARPSAGGGGSERDDHVDRP
jgi:hypothetical protein